MVIEAAPDPPGVEGAAVRQIDLRPPAGFIRAAFHADGPGWGLTRDAIAS